MKKYLVLLLILMNLGCLTVNQAHATQIFDNEYISVHYTENNSIIRFRSNTGYTYNATIEYKTTKHNLTLDNKIKDNISVDLRIYQGYWLKWVNNNTEVKIKYNDTIIFKYTYLIRPIPSNEPVIDMIPVAGTAVGILGMIAYGERRRFM